MGNGIGIMGNTQVGASPFSPAVGLPPAASPDVQPLAPAQATQNPDGSVSNEKTITVQDPRLNGGAPTVIPSMWNVNGVPQTVDPRSAVLLALNSGKKWPGFRSLQEADAFARLREQKLNEAQSRGALGAVPPLWQEQGSVQPSALGIMTP